MPIALARSLCLPLLARGLALLLLLVSPGLAHAQAPLAASDLLLRSESPELRFRWSAAPETALEPAVARGLRREAEQALAAERAQAARDAAEAKKGGFPFRRYDWQQRWSAEGETDTLIAFSALSSQYTGGAHANSGYASLIFDRQAKARIRFADLFSDPKAAFAKLSPAWCQALKEERARRRAGVANDSFGDCPPIAERVIVPVGDGFIHSFRVLAEPYLAGPYSEGRYEIRIDAAPVAGLVKPRFAKGFQQP